MAAAEPLPSLPSVLFLRTGVGRDEVITDIFLTTLVHYKWCLNAVYTSQPRRQEQRKGFTQLAKGPRRCGVCNRHTHFGCCHRPGSKPLCFVTVWDVTALWKTFRFYKWGNWGKLLETAQPAGLRPEQKTASHQLTHCVILFPVFLANRMYYFKKKHHCCHFSSFSAFVT